MMARIIIADDNLDLVETLADYMRAHGHEVEIATDGAEALARYQESDFDVGFMDVRMPVMNGAESFLAIKKIRPRARVVMMTGFDDETLGIALAAGALGPLKKPFSAKVLLKYLDPA